MQKRSEEQKKDGGNYFGLTEPKCRSGNTLARIAIAKNDERQRRNDL